MNPIIISKIDTEAEKIVNEVLKLKKIYQNNDIESLFSIACKVSNIDKNNLDEDYKNNLKKYCICIEGCCYVIGLNKDLPLQDDNYCYQFTLAIDKYLYKYIKPCPLETKITLYKYLDVFYLYARIIAETVVREKEKEKERMSTVSEFEKNPNAYVGKSIKIYQRCMLKEQPSLESNAIPDSVLERGNIVEILGHKKIGGTDGAYWVYVKTANSINGWILERLLDI